MYSEQMLELFNMTKYKPVSIPILLETALTTNNCSSLLEEVNEIKNILYYTTLGLLI